MSWLLWLFRKIISSNLRTKFLNETIKLAWLAYGSSRLLCLLHAKVFMKSFPYHEQSCVLGVSLTLKTTSTSKILRVWTSSSRWPNCLPIAFQSLLLIFVEKSFGPSNLLPVHSAVRRLPNTSSIGLHRWGALLLCISDFPAKRLETVRIISAFDFHIF